jgi:hypothetical protein
VNTSRRQTSSLRKRTSSWTWGCLRDRPTEINSGRHASQLPWKLIWRLTLPIHLLLSAYTTLHSIPPCWPSFLHGNETEAKCFAIRRRQNRNTSVFVSHVIRKLPETSEILWRDGWKPEYRSRSKRPLPANDQVDIVPVVKSERAAFARWRLATHVPRITL